MGSIPITSSLPLVLEPFPAMRKVVRKRPVIAVSLSMTWGARNLVRSGLIRELANTMDVIVLFRWPQVELEETCKQMGAETWVLPLEPKASRLYTGVSRWLDRAQKKRGSSAARRFRQERTRRHAGPLKRCRFAMEDMLTALASMEPVYRLLNKVEPALHDPTGQDDSLVEFLRHRKIDLLLLSSPFQGRETRLMHACKRAAVRTVSLVLGFDNLSTKKRQPIASDYYFTWNEKMRQEVLALFPKVNAEEVKVTGSPQFDFYGDSRWGKDRETFRRNLGLKSTGPLVLFAAGSGKYIPYEHRLVEDLILRLRKTTVGENLSVIVRMHPFERDPSRWDRVRSLSDVVITTPWKEDPDLEWGNITDEEIHLLCGSLKHSQCVINICSTMSLDAVFCDRPVVAPAYDIGPELNYSRHVARLYRQEHFLPITQSGAIQLVDGPEAAVAAILRALNSPKDHEAARRRLTALMLGRPVGESSSFIHETLTRLAQ
jgi:hypothetical protein